jgi:cytochrome oxidase Cu insertion factor (SCO1/SenC/PrrC family)
MVNTALPAKESNMLARSASLLLIIAALLQTGVVVAQGTPPQSRFAENGPKVGDLIPDLTIVDDQGNPVNLRDITRGHYTTITLGCLT